MSPKHLLVMRLYKENEAIKLEMNKIDKVHQKYVLQSVLKDTPVGPVPLILRLRYLKVGDIY